MECGLGDKSNNDNMKPIRNILCYSHYDFNNIMKSKGWIDRPDRWNYAISICSPNEADLAEHWFKKDQRDGIFGRQVFNLDIDDISPFWFENHESECYDKALELYLNDHVKQSNAYFSHLYISGQNKEFVDTLHALDYEEAFALVEWIDKYIHMANDPMQEMTFWVHCAVGASRSQGVVRYIVDTYSNEFDIKLNPNNPNNTYNPHVVMMLKRAYREAFGNIDESYFDTAPQKFNHDIKLNIL